MRFSCAYKAAVLAQPSQTSNQTQILQAISTHASAMPHKAMLLATMEAYACAAIGCDPCCGMDWNGPCCKAGPAGVNANGTINWAALLAIIEKLLAVLLPLLP